MFKSALVKLTGIYLLLLMVVSIFFSVTLYRISTHEVNNRLRRQVDFFNNNAQSFFGGPVFGPDGPNPFDIERQQELTNSRQHIIEQLVYVNVLILICGGIGSYLLARRTLQPIEEAHEAQIRFTADASHELRTPLAAMRAETEVTLRNRKLTVKEAREQLRSNLEELGRLTDLSEGLLQLARGDEDQSDHVELNLNDIVTQAIDQTQPLAAAKDMTVQYKPIKDVKVLGTMTHLTQVVVILLDNAIKYSQAKASVSINATRDHQHVHVAVADHGRGISPEDVSHVFERFYRADTARSQTNVGGHGLGLSIAEQIVASHHGTIQVESTPGKGSRFTITLPMAKA